MEPLTVESVLALFAEAGFPSPHHCIDGSGDPLFECWAGERKLTIWLGADGEVLWGEKRTDAPIIMGAPTTRENIEKALRWLATGDRAALPEGT